MTSGVFWDLAAAAWYIRGMPKIRMQTDPACIEVALDVPMRQVFSYLFRSAAPGPGVRVRVPFGKRTMVGVVVAWRDAVPENVRLKFIEEVLDEKSIFSPILMELVRWTADYYHQPPGEVWRTAVPAVLRKGLSETHGLTEKVYHLSQVPEKLLDKLKRAPVQTAIVEYLRDKENQVRHADLVQAVPGCQAALKTLLNKGCMERSEKTAPYRYIPPLSEPNTLTEEQERVMQSLLGKNRGFSCTLLEGITGSGKTEIYFSLIDQCLERGQQVMVLLPEIALTDQIFKRFEQRFGNRVVQLHSGLSEANRYRRWWGVRNGQVDIVLATRSGVYMEFKSLGLIIVDEEHDLSYKQLEGVRYHARSVAIKRAQLHDIPVLLGSATPSLETCQNVQSGRYGHVQLKERVGDGVLPKIELINLGHNRPDQGLSKPAIAALSSTLRSEQQALVFINRRGYAPVLYCPACQWTAECKRCDSQMTLHQRDYCLQCHHCGARRSVPVTCDACGSQELIHLGEGTQKIEENIKSLFPQASVQRFDRDELNSAGKLQEAMSRVHAREIDILVGTQLLSKGHDFSRVNLVLVINADQGIHSIDFRSPELLVQQLIQVAGRAGRVTDRGRVLIQTHYPQHPALLAVQQHDYRQFASSELAQRKMAQFPPFTHLALWRARGKSEQEVMSFLENVAELGRINQTADTYCFDPVKSPMFKRGGMYHAQLLISAERRAALHNWLENWLVSVEQERSAKKLKWSIDVDPLSLF